MFNEGLLRFCLDTKTGCWNWNVGVNKDTGYAFWTKSDKYFKRAVHRVFYETFVGPLTDSLTIDHLCRNKRCVNPSHLEEVDNRTNVLRGIGYSAMNARKTHCRIGHEYTPDNTQVYFSKRSRYCKTCRVARRKQRYQETGR